MSFIDAIVLGIIHGLTEILPLSKSGHLELGKAILDFRIFENMGFNAIVRLGTAFSTMIVFGPEIMKVIKGIFLFKWNDSTRFASYIIVSMIPAAIPYIFFRNEMRYLFAGEIVFIGFMFLVTAFFLSLTTLIVNRHKEITLFRAIIVGIVQVIAFIPGISRSGATISASLGFGIGRTKSIQFSFLMILPAVLVTAVLDVINFSIHGEGFKPGTEILPLLTAFLVSFLAGLFACLWLIKLVRKGKLIYFAIYNLVIGIITIFVGLG